MKSPPIVVSASGFRHTVREAISESVDVASAIVLFFVRFVIVMTPVFVFVILPLGFVALYFRRRAQRIRLAHELEATPVVD
jgi:heme/copper-type cytochrome/quinol oxidase subunit 2